MFAIVIHFIGILYYCLPFCFVGCLILSIIIKRKLNEKSYFLYREDLRVRSDLII